MKRYYISAFITATVIFTFNSLTVMADGVEVVRDIDKQSFTLSGISEPLSVIRAVVVSPGNEYSDLKGAENPFDIVKYQTEFDAGEDGSFTFEVELNSQSGVYTAYIAIGDTLSEVNLEYVNPVGYSHVINALNGSADIEDYIAQNRNELGFFLSLYDEVNKEKVCDMIKNKMPLPENDIEKCIDIFNSSVIAEAINEGKADGVRDYSDKLIILSESSEVGKWYNKLKPTDVDSKLKKDFNNVNDFNSALTEAIVLSVIKTPDGYLNVKKVISDFKTEIGISSPSSDDRIYKDLAGKSFSSYSDLKAEYQKLLKKYSDSGSSNSSGGGGGGNSGTGTVKHPTVEKETLTPIPKKHFSDMDGALWASEACEFLAEKGILSGKSDGVFAPNDKITREEFVTIIARAFSLKKYTDNNSFSDLTENDWCYEYVLAANQNGVIQGVTENSFGKGMNITRQDMATILYRVIGLNGLNNDIQTNNVTFTDESKISDYAKEAVSYLASAGIINGMDDGSFCGRDNASRAQAAQMIYKVLKSMEG